MDRSPKEILETVGAITIWIVAGLLGLTVVILAGQVLIAFASTGIGAIILLVLGWRWYKKYKQSNNGEYTVPR